MDAALHELLIWVDHAPRTYADAMFAWGSHCPRSTAWEDALDANLVRVNGGTVHLTPSGLAALQDQTANGHR